jgi:hypothetical protein
MMHNCAGPDSAVNGKITENLYFQYLDQSNKWALCCHKNFILRRR